MKLKALLLSCFLILVIASYAVADEESMEEKIDSLKKEVEQIREELNRLKVIILESPLSSDNYSSGSSVEYGIDEPSERLMKEDKANRSNQTKWEKRENWRRLQRGMSKDEVKRILGEPERINVDIYGGESWNYPVRGDYVDIDEYGKLTSWSEPHFN